MCAVLKITLTAFVRGDGIDSSNFYRSNHLWAKRKGSGRRRFHQDKSQYYVRVHINLSSVEDPGRDIRAQVHRVRRQHWMDRVRLRKKVKKHMMISHLLIVVFIPNTVVMLESNCNGCKIYKKS